MELLFSGWKRFISTHRLVENDISRARPMKSKTYWRGRAYISTAKTSPQGVSSEEIEIATNADNLVLHGDYLVRIRLTKAEVANLAKIAFAKDPFGIVAAALAHQSTRKRFTRRRAAAR